MSYGIIPYMVNTDKFKVIWNCKHSIRKSEGRRLTNQALGFSFLARELSTRCLKNLRKRIKEENTPYFRSHDIMQDIFNGEINFPSIPWVYVYLLEGIAAEFARQNMGEAYRAYKEEFPDTSIWEEYRVKRTKVFEDYVYNKTLNRYNGQTMLNNSEWYPCDLSILDNLPYSTPIPIPPTEDFPYISTIKNEKLEEVFSKIDFKVHGEYAREQMKLWFDTAEREGKDLMLFVY